MSRTALPEAAPPGDLADIERRLARVEAAVGVLPARRRAARPLPDADPVAATRDRPGPAPAAALPPAMRREAADRGAPTIHPSYADDPRGAARPAARTSASAPAAPATFPAAPRDRAPRRLDEAFVGGRLLAWAGAAALLFALATLFWLGVRDGWLGEGLRCLLGAGVSAALLAAGLRNAGTGKAREASWAMAGTGLAGLYASVGVATSAYGLLPGVAGLALLAGIGTACVGLALRCDSAPLAGVGLLGALGAPVITPIDGLALPIVLVAMVATGLVLRHRSWTWLATAASLLALPQVAYAVGTMLWDLDGATAVPLGDVLAPAVATVASLTAGLVMVAGWELRRPQDAQRPAMPILLVVHAALAAALGGALALVDQPVAAVVTLGALSALLAGAASHARRRAGEATATELTLLSVAVLVVDLGFAIAADGILQLVGWAVASLAFAALARRAAGARLPLVIGGVGLHAGLALLETVSASGRSDGSFLVACAILAGLCGVSARVISPRSPRMRALLDTAALGVLLWWSAATLAGPDLALALAGQAAALLLLDRRSRDVVARGAGLAFLAIAALVALLHADALAVRASWDAARSIADSWAVAAPVLAVAAGALLAAFALRGADLGGPALDGSDDPDRPVFDPGQTDAVRGFLAASAGGLLLTAASILAGAVASSLGGGDDTVAVVRDVLWASTGLALVAAGLVRDAAVVRFAGLALLGGIAGKIALVDLADVDTAGRVVAWAVLGGLLLAGAALYARLRPAAPADAEPGSPDEDLRVVED